MTANNNSLSTGSDSGDIVISPEPAVVNISPLGFHRYSSEFYEAARSLQRPESYSPVHYYLYCRSLELVLKAYLLAKGISKKKLKNKFRHDLEKTLRKADSLGLGGTVSISDEQRVHLALANAHYKSKAFEYFEVSTWFRRMKGQSKLPSLDVLDSLVGSLLDGIKQICVEA